MLQCRDIPDRANAYIDREGSMASLAAVALHLTACTNCRRYMRGLRAVRRLAAASFRAESPDAALAALGLGDRSNTEPDQGA
ncbi:zf-HC2 domain-containing protein [Methyloraptor flagellatus]|jgi:anti-sigma factor RsiW|uniref:Zf-HC2 domain-containing protein n=1 Tax=Methyloraptor flagellatus TaxID=3162530 RepID=A0AAU7XGN0_9HYPH